MKRKIMADLITWKNASDRKPLLLKGVRQSGKTYILTRFGQEQYARTAYFNFESQPQLCSVFEQDLDTDRILYELSAYYGQKIDAENTLIIFDEIQQCPKAITALKYFCENNRDYSIAAAGSLLGLQLAVPTSYPVGKVDIMNIYPMSFEEYLLAEHQETLLDYVRNMALSDSIPRLISEKLAAFLKDYLICGGMPEVVFEFTQNRDLKKVDVILDNLLMIYEHDFRKYARVTDSPKIDLIWKSIPSQLARIKNKFIYKDVADGARARDYENALQWLINAGMIYRITHISKPLVPLTAYEDTRHFKILACDIGLLRRLARLDSSSIIIGDKHYTEFKGAVAENLFAQEMYAYGLADLFFWTSKSQAEIDFIVANGSRIIPVEVKAADNVRSRSLNSYSSLYNPEIKVRVSMKCFSYSAGQKLISLPHFMLFRFKDMTTASES